MKYIITVCFLLLSFQLVNAQSWVANSGDFYVSPTVSKIGIGTSNPNSKMHINSLSTEDPLRIQVSGSTRLFMSNNGGLAVGNYVTNVPERGMYLYGQLGIGITDPISWAQLDVYKSDAAAAVRLRGAHDGVGNFSLLNLSSVESTEKQWEIIHRQTPLNSLLFAYNNGSNWSNQFIISAGGNVGIGMDNPSSKLDVAGKITTEILEITDGSDLAESFFINSESEILPGMVVSIDSDNIGELRITSAEYDRKVAGIISGANNINSGLILNQKGTISDGDYPVALTGRVYCFVDATHQEVRPGDLLTTSSTPGFAMKVTNMNKAFGSTIGKAMSSLEKGEKGLVLVLVNLK